MSLFGLTTTAINNMEFLSDPIIPYLTLTLGVILALVKYKPLKLLGFWFVCEFACVWFVTGLAEYATAADMITYRYLYAMSAVLFTYHASVKFKTFPKIFRLFFFSIAVLSVLDGIYHYSVRSNLDTWGLEFNDNIGYIIDMGYFLTITGLEALLLALGVTSALANNFNRNPNGCLSRK